jgi:hypothetical protein
LTVDQIGIEAIIKKVRQLLAEEAQLSSALRAATYSADRTGPIAGEPLKP